MFTLGNRIIAVRNGTDVGRSQNGYPDDKHYNYQIGWKGTVTSVNDDVSLVIKFDNGRIMDGCTKRNFDKLKEQTFTFTTGQRVIAIADGYEVNKPKIGPDSKLYFNYEIGWKATIRHNEGQHGEIRQMFIFDNGRVIDGCSSSNFEILEEVKTMGKFTAGQKVKVVRAMGITAKFNGQIGKFLGIISDSSHSPFINKISFNTNGDSCGYLFADKELEVVKEILPLVVGSKVIWDDTSYSMELANNGLTDYQGGGCRGVDKEAYVITATGLGLPGAASCMGPQTNDTIIKRISDNRVFFVKLRFLKEFVAPVVPPKFKRGDFVIRNGSFYRIAKVTGATYTITQEIENYGGCEGVTNVPESSLLGVR